MFRTMSLRNDSRAQAAPRSQAKAWIRRCSAIVAATLVGTTALTATGLTAAPAFADAYLMPEIVSVIDYDQISADLENYTPDYLVANETDLYVPSIEDAVAGDVVTGYAPAYVDTAVTEATPPQLLSDNAPLWGGLVAPAGDLAGGFGEVFSAVASANWQARWDGWDFHRSGAELVQLADDSTALFVNASADWHGFFPQPRESWHFTAPAAEDLYFVARVHLVGDVSAPVTLRLMAYPSFDQVGTIEVVPGEWNTIEVSIPAGERPYQYRLVPNNAGAIHPFVIADAMFAAPAPVATPTVPLTPADLNAPAGDLAEGFGQVFSAVSSANWQARWNAHDFLRAGASVVQLGDDSTALFVNASADWHGFFPQTASWHMNAPAGEDLYFVARVHLVGDVSAPVTLRLMGYNPDNQFAHVAEVEVVPGRWNTIEVELPAGTRPAQFRLVPNNTGAIHPFVIADAMFAAPVAPNRVLSISQTADWQGWQMPGEHFNPGSQYRLQARVLEGSTTGAARFVSQTDDNDFAWLGNTQLSTTEWRDIDVTFTARSTGVDHLRLVGNAAGTFFVDDIVITRVGVELMYANDFQEVGDTSWGGDGGTFSNVIDPLLVETDPEPEPEHVPPVAIDPVVVWSRDFEDGNIAGGDGGEFEVVDNPIGSGLVQRATTAASWHGLQIPVGVFQPGGMYRFEAEVLRPVEGPEVINARFEGAAAPHPWVVGNHEMSATEWTTVSGYFTWNNTDPEAQHNLNPMAVRLVNGGAGAFYMDNVVVTRVGVAAGEIEDTREVVRTWTFETAADLNNAIYGQNVQLSIVDDELAEDGRALRIFGRTADWHAPRIGFPEMQMGAEYQLEITARVATGEGNMEVHPRGLTLQADGNIAGWTYMGNHAVTEEFTTITSNTWLAGDQARISLNTGAGENSTTPVWYIDSMTLYRTAPAPVVDPDFVFTPMFFDFEDGETQGWFSRNARATLAVVEPGAPVVVGTDDDGNDIEEASDHAIRISGRVDQGDGPMFDMSEAMTANLRLQVSGQARFVEPAADPRLTLSMQTGPSSFSNLLTNIQVGQDWTNFSGEFIVPAFTDMANLYFETAWAQGDTGETAAFELDNIRISLPPRLEWQETLIPLRETLPGIHTGLAVDSRELQGEHAELLLHHFTHLVGENHMKPDFWFSGQPTNAATWQPGDDFDTFRRDIQATQILNFARDNNLTVFGHVLVWHSQTPTWFFAPWNAEQEAHSHYVAGRGMELDNSPESQAIMLARMETFIRMVAQNISHDYGLFGTPGNPVNSFEVANEVVSGGPNAATGGMRPNSPYTRIFNVPGVPNSSYRFVREAFIMADHYFNGVFHAEGSETYRAGGDNRVTLWINDYNTERGVGRPDNTGAKRWQLLQLTNYLIRAGAPIDGVGHQFHAGLEWDVNGLRYALELFAARNTWLADWPEDMNRERGLLQAVTEIDVTIPGIDAENGVTEAQLIAQGHYYRQAFDIIRTHQANHGDIDTVTIWGLTDGRSWRAAQLPLLFDDALQAKPAFHGAVLNHHILTGPGVNPPARPGVGGRPVTSPETGWTPPALNTYIPRAYVFGTDVAFDEATFDAMYWDQLPAINLDGGAGQFHARHNNGVLTILANITGVMSPLSTPAQPHSLQIELGERTLVVHQSGRVTEGADLTGLAGATPSDPGGALLADVSDVRALTRVGSDTWQAIVEIPVDDPTVEINLRRRDHSRADLGAWALGSDGHGILSLVEDLSFAQIPLAANRPVIGDFANWAGAQQLVVDTHALSTPGATALVNALWYYGPTAAHHTNETHATLYLQIDVADANIDLSSDQNHLQDSVEIFVGLHGRGAPHNTYDAQFRIHADGRVSLGRGNANLMGARIRSAVEETATGYRVEVAIMMASGGGHQVDQWNYNLAGLGTFETLDIQINDATNGARNSITTWADPTANGFTRTDRQGVIQFVETLAAGPVAPVVPEEPEVVVPELNVPEIVLPENIEEIPVWDEDLAADLDITEILESEELVVVRVPVTVIVDDEEVASEDYQIFVAVDEARFAVLEAIADEAGFDIDLTAEPGTAESIWMELGAEVEVEGQDSVVYLWTPSWIYLEGEHTAYEFNPVGIFEAQRATRGENPYASAVWTQVGTAAAGLDPVVVAPPVVIPPVIIPEEPVVVVPPVVVPVVPPVEVVPAPAPAPPAAPGYQAQPAQPAAPAAPRPVLRRPAPPVLAPVAPEFPAPAPTLPVAPPAAETVEAEYDYEYVGPGYAIDADEAAPAAAGLNPALVIIPIVVLGLLGTSVVALRRRGLA